MKIIRENLQFVNAEPFRKARKIRRFNKKYFRCTKCGCTFKITVYLQKKYPGWNPRMCVVCFDRLVNG